MGGKIKKGQLYQKFIKDFGLISVSNYQCVQFSNCRQIKKYETFE